MKSLFAKAFIAILIPILFLAIKGESSPSPTSSCTIGNSSAITEELMEAARKLVGLPEPLSTKSGEAPGYVTKGTKTNARRVGITTRYRISKKGEPEKYKWSSTAAYFLKAAERKPEFCAILGDRIDEYAEFYKHADPSMATAVIAHESRGSVSVRHRGLLDLYNNGGLDNVGNTLWSHNESNTDRRASYLPERARSAFSAKRIYDVSMNEGGSARFKKMKIPAAYHLTAAFVSLNRARKTLITKLENEGIENAERLLKGMSGSTEGLAVVRALTWLGNRPGSLGSILKQVNKKNGAISADGLLELLDPAVRKTLSGEDSLTNALTKAALAYQFDEARK